MALLDPAGDPQIGEVSPPSRPGLLLTKLYAPRVRSELVVRPRLLDALDRGADRKLTLVSTPPGYGKSTLVVQWLTGADRPAAWVSLDEGDNDPPTFFTYVVAAIQSIDPGIAGGTSTVLDTRSGGPTRAILHSLLNELALATRPFVLVLDDYHVVESPEIHDGIGYLLQNLPLQLRVIITSRTDPPLPLVRMRARGELLELRAADLRFTNEETQELLQGLHKLDVTLSELAALEERTEGWAVGLHLVAHAVQGQPRERVEQLVTELTGNVRLLDDYLWAEAIQQRSPEVQSFLLRSAIFDRFNADLCDAVLGDAGSAAVIRELERANLFLVPLDERGHWFRYHHFFADVLRDHLAQEATDEEICELHVRAAAWFEAHDFAEEAIRHAVAGRDWDRAIRLLRDLGAWLYGQDRVVTMRYWLQGLPADILERDPKLCYWLAWALMRLGEFDAGTRPLRLAEQAWTASNDLAELGASMHLHIMLDFLNQNTHRAIEHAHRALDLLPEDRPTDRSIVYVMLGTTHLYTGDLIEAERAFAQARVLAERVGHLWSQLVELNGFGEILFKRGRLTEATTLFRRAIALGDEWSDEQVQNAHWQLATVFYELNRLDVAEQHLHRAMELIERMGAPLHLVRIHPLLAQIAWARQDAETAYEEIEQAITQTARVGSRLYFLQAARALQARFWLTNNQLGLARHWADECGLDPYAPPEYGRQFEHLTIIRLLILDGHTDVALRLLDRLLAAADAAERGRDVLEMLILRALAQHNQDDQEGAAATLDRALKFGAPEGFVRIFADEGPRLIPLLRYAAARGQHRDYAHRLLAAIDGSAPASAPDQAGLVSPLSEREVEVLRLVAAGLPNRDIGQRLFISEKTVKKHLSNILGKLGATNRTQAVDQARRLGLL